jgi:hypothetical protein
MSRTTIIAECLILAGIVAWALYWPEHFTFTRGLIIGFAWAL